jgi:hypothetical protein
MILSSMVRRAVLGALLVGTAFGVVACNEVDDQKVSFTVLSPFNLINSDQKTVAFPQGTLQGEWSTKIYDTDKDGRIFVIEGSGSKYAFRVPKEFYLSYGSSSAASTGQGVGVVATQLSSSPNDREFDYEESCDIVRSEEICDDFRGHRECHTRTATRRGTRTVHVRESGSYDNNRIQLVDANGGIYAQLDMRADHTYENKNNGACHD